MISVIRFFLVENAQQFFEIVTSPLWNIGYLDNPRPVSRVIFAFGCVITRVICC
jgi:hypothetical protein